MYLPGNLRPAGRSFADHRTGRKEPAMSANHDIAKLDDLIVTTIDSVKGYEQSAESAPRGCYTSFFHEMARERREVVDALQMRSRVLGGTPADYGSAAGT